VHQGHWTKQDEADDLHRLLRHLGHDSAFVLGTDVGTMTVHAWAQRHPQDVTRLVLSECFLPGFGPEEHLSHLWHFGFHAESEFAAKLVEGREEQYLSWFHPQMTRGGITGDDHAELLRTLTRPGGMRGGFEHYATVPEDGRNARAGSKVEVPVLVLVLHGEYGLPPDVLLNGAREAATDVRAGHTVLGLTRDPSTARDLVVDEVAPVAGDLAQPDTWRPHLDGTDAVVHLVMDLNDPAGTDRGLFAGIAEAEERDGLRRRLVYTTGISAYGRTGVALMDENTPGNPESPIGFRFALESELAANGLAHTVVRPGFIYGGAATTSMTAQWFAAAEAGTPVFYGDTTKRWSRVHVDDLAEATCASSTARCS
jgi:hypothetical protein